MHCLEHILLVTAVAVERNEISQAELTRTLKKLASASSNYVPERREPIEIRRMNDEWHQRFGHLMHGDRSDANEHDRPFRVGGAAAKA